MQKCEDEKYLKVMSARENIICSSPLYESEWVKNWKKESKNLNKVTMFVEGKY